MQVESVPFIAPMSFTSSLKNQGIGGEKPGRSPMENSDQGAAALKSVTPVETSGKPELKETAREMFKEPQKMGEFKNKKGLEETTDLAIGGDIRYALKSRNVDFLKRLSLGGLTVSEFREVKYRIRELENKMIKSPNVFIGKMIDPDQNYKPDDKGDITLPNIDTKV